MHVGFIDYLCLFIIIVHLLDCCRYLYRLHGSLRWLESPQVTTSHVAEQSNTIHVLIPVYNEGSVIEASIRYFTALCEHASNVSLYYISTQKEGEDGETIRALRLLEHHHHFTWLHYPYDQGKKADQLNWAIEHILSGITQPERVHTYFGVYDVDSRPEPQVLQTMYYAQGPAYQQPSVFLENYRDLGLFQRAGALLQTRWELARNIPVLRENERRYLRGASLASLTPCTGHGLFFHTDLLQNGPLFSTNILAEDLELGYRLAFENIPLLALSQVDYCEYAPTPLVTIPQAARWFSGEFHLYRYYLHNQRARRNPLFAWLVLKRYYLTFKWALGAPLLAAAMIVLVSHTPAALVLILLSLLLYIFTPLHWLSTYPQWKKYIGPHSTSLLLYLAAIFRPLFNSLGPLSYLLGAPLRYWERTDSAFVKTPRKTRTKLHSRAVKPTPQSHNFTPMQSPFPTNPK